MDGRPSERIRVALVDLDVARLDRFRDVLAGALAGGEDVARSAEVRLVVHDDGAALPWRWAALAGVPRSGEVATLSEVVVEGVLLAAESPRAEACARLAAALGARVLRVPATAGFAATAPGGPA